MSELVATPTPTPPNQTLSDQASRLFRVYKVLHSLLSKRNYAVSSNDMNLDAAGFIERFGNNPERESLTILVSKITEDGNNAGGVASDTPQEQLIVFFPTDDKVGVKPIKTYTDQMRENGISNAILVLKQGITPFAKQAVMEMSDEFRIEHFRESELLIDITLHQLVPEHQVLTSSEKTALLKRYRLKDSQLPRIQSSDPVARFFGMKRGNVVKIIRPSETAGRYVTYRVCI